MQTFLCSYGHDGSQWGFEIMAESRDDAEARLAAIKAWGKVDGESVMKVPGHMGWFARLVVRLRNAFT